MLEWRWECRKSVVIGRGISVFSGVGWDKIDGFEESRDFFFVRC